jgi:hypothetical protein
VVGSPRCWGQYARAAIAVNLVALSIVNPGLLADTLLMTSLSG